jgi:hypothetical protein
MDSSLDRVRRHTAASVLRRIDDETVSHLADVARRPDSAPGRLHALDREWDLDRVLETEAASMGLLGLALGAIVSPRLLAMPGVVGAAILLFATSGLYPLLPLFRRLGVRTGREIERERYAVKALRGDFTEARPSRRGGEARNDDAARGGDEPADAGSAAGGLH